LLYFLRTTSSLLEEGKIKLTTLILLCFSIHLFLEGYLLIFAFSHSLPLLEEGRDHLAAVSEPFLSLKDNNANAHFVWSFLIGLDNSFTHHIYTLL